MLLKGAAAARHNMHGRTVGRHWAGLRPLYDDRRPVIGKLSQNVLIAGGHFKIGVGTAPITSRIIGDIVQGKELDSTAKSFDPLRKVCK